MKRKRTLGIMLLSVMVLLATGYWLFAVPKVPDSGDAFLAEVQRRDLFVEIMTLGTLEAEQAHMLSSQIRGPEAKIIYLAQNGRFVAQGEELVRFDAQPFEEAVADLQVQVEGLGAAVEAAEQLVAWEKSEADQRMLAAEYQHKVAGLDLQRLVDGEGPLKLAQLRDELDKATLALQRHQAYQQDLQALADEGIVKPAELDRVGDDLKILGETHRSAKLQYDSYERYVLPVQIEAARTKEQNARLTIEQVRQANVHKIAGAVAALNQARGRLKATEADLAKARAELDKTVLLAPFDGLIVHYETFRDGEMRTPREGDTVIVNQPILYFPDISSLIVKSRVRESDLHRIKLGQKVTVAVDAYPEERFPGTLTVIGALAKKGGQQAEEKYFQVVFALSAGDTRLRPGMSASAVIHVAELHQVPAVPLQAVFRDSSGDYCYRYTGSSYERRAVTVGGRNEQFVEIVTGLAVGDRVAQVEPEAVID